VTYVLYPGLPPVARSAEASDPARRADRAADVPPHAPPGIHSLAEKDFARRLPCGTVAQNELPRSQLEGFSCSLVERLSRAIFFGIYTSRWDSRSATPPGTSSRTSSSAGCIARRVFRRVVVLVAGRSRLAAELAWRRAHARRAPSLAMPRRSRSPSGAQLPRSRRHPDERAGRLASSARRRSCDKIATAKFGPLDLSRSTSRRR